MSSGVLRRRAITALWPATALLGLAGPAAAEGVYTTAQSARGESVYQASCASCHMPDLAGRAPAPELAGDAFLQRWSARSVGDLYAKVRTMPLGKPDSLPAPSYLDLTAFLLSANDIPPGPTELGPEASGLKSPIGGK